MSQITDILKGHLNELTGANEDLSETRLNICRECPLFKDTINWGPMCDSSKYISEDGEQWSLIPLPGYVKGCGCRLRAKTRIPNISCIVGKW